MQNQIRTILSVIIITALLLGSGLPFGEQPATAADGEGQDLPPIELPEKGNPKLDSQLNQLVSAQTSKRAASFAQESNIELVDGNVRVIIECLADQVDAAVKAASAIGVVETSYRNLLQVVVPVPQLTALADTTSISLVRLPWHPVAADNVSEGVELISADEWQTASYNGTGVKVAILDVGFTGYADLLGTELPASVTTRSFYAGSDIEGYSAHGTACAEIVYDIAPDADFYLVNFNTDVEMGNAVDWLINTAEVDVISNSVVWPIYGPGDGTGPICEMVDDARAAGILWSVSMGNYAQQHWQGDFVDTEPDLWHNFSGADEGNSINVTDGDTIIVLLKWDDTWGASGNDYDLYLVDNTSTIVWGSEGTQDGNDDPVEGFSYTANYTGFYSIAIRRYSATETVNFHLFSIRHNPEYQVASSSFAIPADSPNAMSVGAVPWNNPTTLESFSSRGPTEDNRIKPDLVAPDGVSTATYGATDFYGTSASAPHVAGAAALVKERYPSYTPAQIQAFLEGRAVELGAAGKDNLFGSGRLDLGSILVSIEITPPSPSISAGRTQQFTATGTYSDNSTPDITDNVTWSSDNTSVATIGENTGLAQSLAEGQTTITAASGNVSDNTTLTVGPKVLDAINITPDNPTIALGRSQQFTATGTYSDNSTPDITDNVTWSSDNTSVATIGENTGLAQSVAEGQTTITAASGNVSDTTTLTVTAAVLDSIEVTPPSPSISAGRTQQFTATGTYSDNSTADLTTAVTWASDNTSVATIGENTGLAQSVAEGQTTITATSGAISDTTTLTVTAAVLDSIEVTPANPSIAAGRTQQFTATGTYSDNSTDNITTSVTWSSDNTSVATIGENTGLAQSLAEGQTTITATSGAISDNTTLTVGPKVLDAIDITPDDPTIALGRAQQFTATGTYSDNTTPDITDNVTWTSDNTSVATIGVNTGLAQSLAEGQTTITAASGNVSDTTILTVGPKALDAIAVTPPNPSIDAGRTQQFTATGTYSDNSTGNITTSVTWSSDNTSVATIGENTGLAQSLAEGQTTITAASGNVSDNTTLTVGPKVLDAINITPDNPTIALGRTQQFTATGTYSDNSTADLTTAVTWASDNTSVATIGENTGLAQSLAEGQTTITATSGAISDTTILTVGPKALDAIAVTPPSPSISVGRTQQFTATGTYSDNSTADLTTAVTWASDNTSVATIGENTGLAQSVAEGQTTITATSGAISDNTTLAVTAAVLDSIEVTPANPSIAAGRTQQFTATGTYSDNSTDNITTTVTWSSDNTSVATIGENTGLAQSLAEGQTTITAASGNVSDNTTLTVGPKVLDAIDITPDDPTIALGRSQQFTAIGTYSDNSTPDITDNVTWTSDNTSVATIGVNTGLAQSLAEGQTTITVTLGNVSDNTTLTVGPKALDAIAVTPANPSIDAGRTEQFTATGTYSDNSTDNLTSSVNWSSSNTTVARINAAGLATSYAAGTTVITATSDNISGNTTLTVDPAVLDSIIVTPVNPAIVFVSGNPPTLQFVATASYSDGETALVTGTANWTSDNTSVATIGVNTGLATTVADGTTVITATYDGTAGNTTLTVLPDTVPPVVTLTSPTEGLTLGDTTLAVSGNVDDVAATANVSVIVNGGTPIALTLGASGNFSDNVTLNFGSNTVLVTAVDSIGNTGTSGTITVVVDPDKPTITITQPVARVVTDNSSLAVIGIISGNVTSANVILNGVSQSVNVTAESFSANVILVEGINILVVNAYIVGYEDESDYLGTSGVRIVTLDTTAPVVIIDSPVSGRVVSTPGHVVSGTIDDPCVSTANLTLDGASQWIPVVGGNFSQSITLESGNNTITVMVTDEVGNSSSANVTIRFDNTKPEVTITAPANNLVTNVADQAVTGTVNDTTITTANLTVNDGTPRPISVTDGSFSANVTLVTGANTLEVTASANATPSNIGTSGVVNVTLDNTAPAITIGLSDPTDSIAITVSSNEALAAAPTASVNATVTVMTQTDVNKWSGTYGSTGSPIADGAYSVTANATDKAGNTANRTATFCKQTVTITDNETETVSTGTTTLQISTTANVTDASVSVTQHLDNPSGNVGSPAGAEKAAGAFVEIVVSPELRDNLEQIDIRVDYDPGELPADTDESKLRLYLWDVASGTWQVVTGSGVNTAEDYIYGTITHLSKYGGFGTVADQLDGDGGGGGGGGGWLPGVCGVLGVTTDKGKFTEDVTCRSEDKKVELFIPEDTIGKNRVGSLLSSTRIREMEDPPNPPEQTSIIGLVYGIGPDGANFDPPIDLTIKYDVSLIPEGVAEKNLIVAWWDKTASNWVELESTVDLQNDAVKAKVSHFTAFTILAHTRPASFTITDLSVTPGEIDLGESVSISVFTTNTGDLTGTYEVSLKIDNVVAQTKEVTLGGGDSEVVSFSVTPDTAGEHTVNISDLLGTFEVKVPEAPPAPAVAPAPASFATSDLSVTPSEVKPAEQVTISAVVTNTGGSEGSYTIVLKINGAEEAKKEVTLGAGRSETVTFTIAKDAEGKYAVNIDGKVGQFTVIVPPPPTPTPTEALPVQPPTNWWLIGGIIAGCVVVVGLLVYFFVWPKRAALVTILSISRRRRGS